MLHVISILTYVLLSLGVLAFFLLAWRDIGLLVRRPPGLGRGIGRVWAVGRTAMAEGRAAWIWWLPVLWIIAAGILSLMVRPHGDDERERISIYITVLLQTQEYVLLVFLGVLACFSLPRERERKTIITTGSKPLSRLELFLGKVTGFTALAGILLVIMGTLTYARLLYADSVGKSVSYAKFQRAQADYEKGVAGQPPEGLKRDADYGVLQAGNFILPAEPVQIAGWIDYRKDPTTGQVAAVRYLKGGSVEKLLTRFNSVFIDPSRGTGGTPRLYFGFEAVCPGALPDQILLNVRLWAERSPTSGGIKEYTLPLKLERNDSREGVNAGFYSAAWQPSPENTFGFVISRNPDGSARDLQDFGPIRTEVSCGTDNTYLAVADDQRGDNWQSNVLIVEGDPALGPSPQGASEKPMLVGFEKNGAQQIQGPSDKKIPLIPPFVTMPKEQLQAYAAELETATARFRSRDISGTQVPRNSDDTFLLSLYLDVEKYANNSAAPTVLVSAYNLGSPEGRYDVPVSVSEKRLTAVKIPSRYLTNGDDLVIDIRSLTPGHWITIGTSNVHIDQADSLFVWNLMKSEIVIFFEVLLLIIVAVAVSTRLGGAVALVVTVTAFGLGMLLPFVQKTATEGSHSFFTAAEQQAMAHNFFYNALNVIYGVVINTTLLLVNILPDFRIFDSVGFISAWRNMPLANIGTTLFWCGFYGLPFIALAYLMSRKQELA